ncbi:MAG: hypothetical protein KDB37_20085, partial [Ilumatobacter sp.]|nr:hypothetical protein [Ilumatobacter sp.]
MKQLPLVFGLFVATVLVVVAFVFLDTDTQDESVVLGGRDPTASQPSSPALAPVANNGERTAMQVAAPVVAVVETPVGAIPESYRQALGGLVGRVVEESGEPVADVRVAIAGGGATTFLFPRDGIRSSDLTLPDLILGEARTDGEGRFRIEGLETRVLGAVLIDPGGPRAFFTVLEQVPESGAVRDLGDIVLPACVTLTGIVVDERDVPLPGVRVRAPNIPNMALGFGVEDFRAGCSILVDDDSLDQPFVFVPPREVERYEKLLPFPTTFTDSEGRFTLPGVQPGLPSLVLDDGVHLASVLGPIPTGAAGSTKDMGRIPMPDGESLVVRVLDDQNEPVAGASVMVGSRLKVGPVAILKGPFTTAADGRVEVGGLRASLASGAARTDARQAWAPSTESVSAGTGQELKIVLPGLRTATLVVRDADGRAVPGARILGRAMPNDDDEDVPDFIVRPDPLDDRVEIGEDGEYIVSQLSPHTWEFIVDADGYALERKFVNLVWHDERETFELQAVASHPIQVVRASDRSPVEHALLVVYGDESWGRQLTTARTKKDGTAELRSLADGSYSVEVVYPGLAVTRASVDLPSEEPVVVELLEGATIKGSVIDRGGPPSEPLLIMLQRRGERSRSSDVPRLTVSDL